MQDVLPTAPDASARAVEIFTDDEAARYLRVSARNLRQLIQQGDGPPFFFVGRRRRFRKCALDHYAARRECA